MPKPALNDARWDKKLNISTGAANFERDDAHHCRYEPTHWAVLERLARSGYIHRDSTLVDYGCGKGRVPFFMNWLTGCRAVGVEYDPDLAAAARANLQSYAGRREAVRIECANAETYMPEGADCFYFFNPFSENILRSVMGRVMTAYYAAPRTMRLFFYYTQDPYLDYLMNSDDLTFEGEIDCRDLFHNDDPREKILIFRLG